LLSSSPYAFSNNWEPWVAKKYIKATENEKKLFEDDIMTQASFPLRSAHAQVDSVSTQVISKQFADQYNKFQMPKTVDFVVPFLMEVTRAGKTVLYCVEAYVFGCHVACLPSLLTASL
jgi:hypothetical protein